MLELLSVYESSGSVVHEDEVIFSNHLFSSRIFRISKSVFDDLENKIVRREGKDEHDHSLLASGRYELIIGGIQMAQQVSVKFGLSVFVVADRYVEFGFSFERHYRLQKLYELARPIRFHMEVRAREAEYDARFVLTE